MISERTVLESPVRPILCLAAALLLTGYRGCQPPPPEGEALDDVTLARYASVGPFQPRNATVITDNDAAFAAKLRMVEEARESIDMMYFVYWGDYSSAVFSEALLAAAGRGVAVRLLLDYDTNYPELDYFTMLEREAASGPGSLEVRLYNRPSRRIIRDAVFMTMGCAVEADGGEPCDERKFEVIESAFAEEGMAPGKNLTNLNLAHSGLLLSGWYTRNTDAMALAVVGGQGLDLAALGGGGGSGGSLESVKKLAKIYWLSKNGPFFQRIHNKLKLAAAYVLHRGEIDQLRETVTSL